jgi:hypothetical protein
VDYVGEGKVLQENEVIWIWDALKSSWFTHCAWIVMGAGDMLRSAKINGMAGQYMVIDLPLSRVPNKATRRALKCFTIP